MSRVRRAKERVALIVANPAHALLSTFSVPRMETEGARQRFESSSQSFWRRHGSERARRRSSICVQRTQEQDPVLALPRADRASTPAAAAL
ncbi:MAG: hypothetical protein OXG37_15710 [Actinomycetia bacterium]|nr:hypothetical protein [Actinomycetes bacterium]